jgi:hypothetical protein
MLELRCIPFACSLLDCASCLGIGQPCLCVKVSLHSQGASSPIQLLVRISLKFYEWLWQTLRPFGWKLLDYGEGQDICDLQIVMFNVQTYTKLQGSEGAENQQSW